MSSGEEPLSDVDNDIETIVEGEEQLENIENQETNAVETIENEQNSDNEGNADGTKTVVKPKRVIKNPQPKLNEQTLKGPKGLAALEGYFERVKFKGRGYEEQDLNVLMKTYEYWCHRLFPKFPFDDCIARLEKLGTKKATQTQIKRLRLDINLDDDKPLSSDEGENDTTGFVDAYNDQFDQLLPTTREPVIEMTEDQLERMQQNKERAKRLREERLRKIRENAEHSLGESSRIITQSSQELDTTEHSFVVSGQKDIYITTGTNENDFASNRFNSQDYQPETTVDDNCSQITSSNENTNELKHQNQQEDNENDTLGVIEKNTIKRKTRVIESDSEEDEILTVNKNKTAEKNTRNILESDEDNGIIANIGDNCAVADSVVNHNAVNEETDEIHPLNDTQIENENETEEGDIEDILTEINTDISSAVGVKGIQAIESSESNRSDHENQPMDAIEETA